MEEDSSSPSEHIVTGSPRQNGFETYKDYYSSKLGWDELVEGNYVDHFNKWRRGGTITMLDISSSGSISEPVLFPIKDTRNRESMAGFHRRIRFHDNSLRTRVVIFDSMQYRMFLDLFALEYGLDPDILKTHLLYLQRATDGKIVEARSPHILLPVDSCSKSKPQILNLGYGRFALAVERVCGAIDKIDKHALNIVFSKY